MLTREGCGRRQARFREELARQGIDAAVLTDPHEVYYLTGFLGPNAMPLPALLYIETNGGAWLAAHTDETEAHVEARRTYDHHLLYTSNPDPMRRLTEVVRDRMGEIPSVRRLGWQAESLPRQLAQAIDEVRRPGEWIAIDDTIAELETRKEPDEVALLRMAAGCAIAAYAAVGAAITPGLREVDALAIGQEAATRYAGEQVFHSGDYRAGEFGGFARDRAIEAGELYVIDGWATYRGYWADLCRTFAVGEPTALQREIHGHVADVLADVPNQLRPGVDTTEFWWWIDRRLREHPRLRETGLIHHGGHGVGLRAHEAPDINRDRGGILEPGVVVSVEPGAYFPELNAGIRLENTFLITETGCELLSDHPFAWD